MNNFYKILPDKSVITSDNKILFFSIEKFIEDIVIGDCCFVCGATRKEKKFNDEHVIPNWILKKYNLHNRQITLPNKTTIKYSQNKIPCCLECNQLLGNKIEKQISKIVSKGYVGLFEYLKSHSPWKIFLWLCLIFLKTHLKDRELRLKLDRRAEDYKISDLYIWENLHHIHCLIRTIYTGCSIDSNVFSSFLVLPARNDKNFEPFDFGTVFDGKGILLRLNDICFISILNDSCFSQSLFEPTLKKISGSLTPIQYREIFAHLLFINLNMKKRPEYYTSIENGFKCKIKADVPEIIELLEPLEHNLGDILYHCCGNLINNTSIINKEEIINGLKKGKYTFLFNDNGEFNEKSMVFNNDDVINSK